MFSPSQISSAICCFSKFLYLTASSTKVLQELIIPELQQQILRLFKTPTKLHYVNWYEITVVWMTVVSPSPPDFIYF